MYHITLVRVLWIAIAFSLLVPVNARAQSCVNAYASPSSEQIDVCNGSSQTQTRYTKRTFTMNSNVSCNQGGYFGASFPTTYQDVGALGMCGYAPAGYTPQCPGAVGFASPWGLDGGLYIWRVQIQSQLFDGTNCAWVSPVNAEIGTQAQGCGGAVCCSTEAQNACSHGGGLFSSADDCSCSFTPIIIAMEAGRLELTDAAGGANFDLNPDGHAERLGWTQSQAADAFLVLDRNGNGFIDDGKELFGSATDQPPTDARNGFNALSVFDSNHDNRIDARDGAFGSLRLWTDRNHNGKSEADELQGLKEAGLVEISLLYRESRRVDRHGNQFRYVATAKHRVGRRIVERLAWDVFLVGF